MPLTYEQIVPPTSEPVTVDELKTHLHYIGSDEDADMQLMLLAAREDIERCLHRQLMPATYVLYMDWFPRQIRLPHSPVQSIDRIDYLDQRGNLQTVPASTYQADLVSEPARITESENGTWPTTQSATYNVVQVHYIAGYVDADDVPEPIKLVIKMHAGDMFEHRESRLDRPREIAAIEDNPTYSRLLTHYMIPRP